MSNTYCGKNCNECTLKEELNCPGCLVGPGAMGGGCELASCCRTKGHENCSTCGFRVNCEKLNTCEQAPENRIKKLKEDAENAAQKKAFLSERAPFLGKCMAILFWTVVPALLGEILTSGLIGKTFPKLYVAGLVLQFLCSLVYGIVLLCLSSKEIKYLPAGVSTLFIVVLCIPAAIFAAIFRVAAVVLILYLLSSITRLVSYYFEFSGHSAVLEGLDDELSGSWELMWKWLVGCLVAIFAAFFVMCLFGGGLLTGLVLFGASLGIIIIAILKYVFLYRSARAYKIYLADPDNYEINRIKNPDLLDKINSIEVDPVMKNHPSNSDDYFDRY